MSDEDPSFLELEEYSVSIAEARKIVTKHLNSIGIVEPKGGWGRAVITFGGKKATFMELVQSVRISGVMPYIQNQIDKRDAIFGGTWGITTPTMGFGVVSHSYAGYSKSFAPPMRSNPVEWDLTKDILFYREESCLNSDDYDFEMCTRYYRAYLTSCVALVDAFINRHLLIYKHRGERLDDLDIMQRTSRLEDRLMLFLKMSTGKEPSIINSGIEWTEFKKLRVLRNEITHINGPTLGYSIGEIGEHLNYCKRGIGGLLLLIRKAQKSSSLGFIEQIRNAPIVYFNEITHNADGNHIINRRK